MSLIETSLYSNILKKEMRLCVYRPSGYDTEPLPVLYFLHGRTGNEQLLRQLAMDKTADEMLQAQAIKPMMIVCPHLDNSRGINSAEVYREVKGKYGTVHKGRYEDYLVDELIPFTERSFQCVKTREGRYIGGISSGGCTALQIALLHRDLFSKVGGHMPAIDLSFADEDECYFESEAMWLKYNPIQIAKGFSSCPLKVFLDDGKDDEGQFYRACESLYQILKQKGAQVQNHLFDGAHDAAYILSNMKTYLRFYGA